MPDNNTEHQLLRLHVLLGDDESQLDEVYQAFQAVDHDRVGSLKTAAELASVLRGILSPKDFKRIDFDKLAGRFSSKSGHFDYTAFCKALQRPLLLQSELRGSRSQSPTKRRSRSPTKRQHRARLRIDKRLESQRLITESVRRKLMRGIQGGETDGYQGLQNLLRSLDVDGDGYLDVHVFTKKILQRLNCPLTRPEREFLLEQLRALSTEKGENVFDYEQLDRICNLNSDDSVSESDTDQEPTRPPSLTKSLQLGSGFLIAETRLHEFLRNQLVASENTGENLSKSVQTRVMDTPRCLFTGAERFLEIAEEIDQDNTGLLHEDEFSRILSKCGVDISTYLLNGMLSRFPRSAGKFIRYSEFLQRYGQNPQCTRARRELKQLVHHFFSRLTVPTTEWLRFLRQRFESFDSKGHGMMKNALPTDAFLRAVQGRSSVLKLSTDEAAQVTSLFLRSSINSSPSRLQYHEFLMFVDECHRIPCIDTSTNLASTQDPSSISPKRSLLSRPEATTAESMAKVDTSKLSVGDYLMFHATRAERSNFEHLMDMLQKFQNHAEGDSEDHESTIQRIVDGIMMPLGKRLRVKVQFSMD